MPGGNRHPVHRFLRRLVPAGAGGDATDRQLLKRFAGHREEAAFAALVQRHGPMVLGVCRRVSRDPHDADDAFQATFMVLARKAGSLAQPEKLANWLYGVAYRAAARAKAKAARRRTHERQVPDMPPPEARPDGGESLHRFRPVLDEELQRLPEKYRAPLVLCYLEGQTYAEAAQKLGWAAGTVSGRLARAREVLRGRLTRRGVTLSAGAFATALSHEAAPAAVPPALAGTTAEAAMQFAAGSAAAGAGIVLGPAAALAEGVLQTMLAAKRTNVAVLALSSGLIIAGAGLFAYHACAARQVQPPVARPTPPAPAPHPETLPERIERLFDTEVEPRLKAAASRLLLGKGGTVEITRHAYHTRLECLIVVNHGPPVQFATKLKVIYDVAIGRICYFQDWQGQGTFRILDAKQPIYGDTPVFGKVIFPVPALDEISAAFAAPHWDDPRVPAEWAALKAELRAAARGYEGTWLEKGDPTRPIVVTVDPELDAMVRATLSNGASVVLFDRIQTDVDPDGKLRRAEGGSRPGVALSSDGRRILFPDGAFWTKKEDGPRAGRGPN